MEKHDKRRHQNRTDDRRGRRRRKPKRHDAVADGDEDRADDGTERDITRKRHRQHEHEHEKDPRRRIDDEHHAGKACDALSAAEAEKDRKRMSKKSHKTGNERKAGIPRHDKKSHRRRDEGFCKVSGKSQKRGFNPIGT